MSIRSSLTQEPARNGPVGVADGLTVAEDGDRRVAKLQSAICGIAECVRGPVIPPGSRVARRNAIRVHDDGHVVPWVHADVHSLILCGRLDFEG